MIHCSWSSFNLMFLRICPQGWEWDFIAPSFLVIVTFLLLLPERFYYVDRRRKLLRSSFHFVLANLLENLLNNNNNSHSIFLLLSFGIVIVISFFSRWINLSQSDAFFFFFDGSPARLANPMNDVFFCCCFLVWGQVSSSISHLYSCNE